MEAQKQSLPDGVAPPEHASQVLTSEHLVHRAFRSVHADKSKLWTKGNKIPEQLEPSQYVPSGHTQFLPDGILPALQAVQVLAFEHSVQKESRSEHA